MVDGVPNGVGRFISNMYASIWEGQWENGKRHGFCRSIYNGGYVTFGKLDDGKWKALKRFTKD